MKKELTPTQPTTPIQDKAVLALVDTIRAEIEAGKERAYPAMEREKRQTYSAVFMNCPCAGSIASP